jgi:hypothetical protein
VVRVLPMEWAKLMQLVLAYPSFRGFRAASG